MIFGFSLRLRAFYENVGPVKQEFLKIALKAPVLLAAECQSSHSPL